MTKKQKKWIKAVNETFVPLLMSLILLLLAFLCWMLSGHMDRIHEHFLWTSAKSCGIVGVFLMISALAGIVGRYILYEREEE